MLTRLFISAFLLVAQLLEARLPDLIPYRKGDLWGYADSTKKIIIKPEFENVRFFVLGRAVVRKNGKYGIIDSRGVQVLPFIYKELYPLAPGYWKAALLGRSYGVIDSTGKFVVPPIHKNIWPTGGNYIAVVGDSSTTIMSVTGTVVYTIVTNAFDEPPIYIRAAQGFTFSSLGKFGVVDIKGRIRIPVIYDVVWFARCGYFICDAEGEFQFYKDNYKRCKKRRLPKACTAEAIRNRNPVWLEPAYTLLPAHTREPDTNWPPVYPKDDSVYYRKVWGWKKTSYMNEHWAAMPKYDSTGRFSFNLAVFEVKGRLGLVDTGFMEVIPPKYELLQVVNEQFAMVMRRPRVDFAKNPDLRIFLGYVDIHGTEYWEN